MRRATFKPTKGDYRPLTGGVVWTWFASVRDGMASHRARPCVAGSPFLTDQHNKLSRVLQRAT